MFSRHTVDDVGFRLLRSPATKGHRPHTSGLFGREKSISPHRAYLELRRAGEADGAWFSKRGFHIGCSKAVC